MFVPPEISFYVVFAVTGSLIVRLATWLPNFGSLGFQGAVYPVLIVRPLDLRLTGVPGSGVPGSSSNFDGCFL